MEFKTAEEKLLHDYDVLEEENMRLHDENEMLKDRIKGLEESMASAGERARRLEAERDHHADCVKDMLATAAFYGFEQPAKIMFNEETGTMRPAYDEPGERCTVHVMEDEGLA